jgi:hypothetical protein
MSTTHVIVKKQSAAISVIASEIKFQLYVIASDQRERGNPAILKNFKLILM